MKKIGLCCDHAGYELKEYVKNLLEKKDWECIDFGTYSQDRADYPDYAHKLGKAIDENDITIGIAICGSGNGISMALNKHRTVRAALSWNPEIAELARLHNDANVLSLPARFISKEIAEEIISKFLSTNFEGGRHKARVAKIALS